MDDNTTKIIKDKFNSLPESIQEAITSSDYQNTLIEIGAKYKLNVEQMGILERETTLVMMGLTPTKNFEVELTRELNIDTIKGGQIVADINEKIFFRIRELLKIMNTPEEGTTLEKEPSKTESQATDIHTMSMKRDDTSVLDNAGIKIIDPNLNALELKAPISTEHPILTQKLTDSFQIKATKTEHSLDNITKTNTPTSSYTGKSDPYRLSPEE